MCRLYLYYTINHYRSSKCKKCEDTGPEFLSCQKISWSITEGWIEVYVQFFIPTNTKLKQKRVIVSVRCQTKVHRVTRHIRKNK